MYVSLICKKSFKQKLLTICTILLWTHNVLEVSLKPGQCVRSKQYMVCDIHTYRSLGRILWCKKRVRSLYPVPQCLNVFTWFSMMTIFVQFDGLFLIINDPPPKKKNVLTLSWLIQYLKSKSLSNTLTLKWFYVLQMPSFLSCDIRKAPFSAVI